jgi:hypothetical protein
MTKKLPAALGRPPWRPPLMTSAQPAKYWPVLWPIHDLVVTDLLVWILPTHKWTHIVRFVTVLGLIVGGGARLSLWILLLEEKEAERITTTISFESRRWKSVEADVLLSLARTVILSILAFCCWWIYWYYQTTLYAIHNKPWMNPQVPSIRRLELHAPLRLFDDIEQARRAACLPHQIAWNATPQTTPSSKSTNTTARRKIIVPKPPAPDGDATTYSTGTNTRPLTRNVLLLDSFGVWQFQLLSTVEEGLALVQNDSSSQGRRRRRRHDGDETTNDGDDEGDTAWAPIQVPGHWMLQEGVDDIPIYTNKKYPFPCHPPIVPRQNPTGVYKLPIVFPENAWRMTIPPPPSVNTMDEQQQHSCYEYSILLHGIESACFVYWNGQFLGFCKDSRLPSEFAIPLELLVQKQKNGSTTDAVLHLVMARWSDGSYMEDQDHWWMAGLHRSVELIRRPPRADILDYRVHATASRELTVAVQLRNHNHTHKEEDDRQTRTTTRRRYPHHHQLSLTARLYEDKQLTPDGDQWLPAREELWSQTQPVEYIPGTSTSTSTTTMAMTFQSSPLPQVQLWTAETPKLYTLLLIQSDPTTGETLQVESCRVGFRSIDISKEDGILRVNGRPITVCGINRHEHDPDHGKVVSLKRMKQDIVTLKRNNFNAIRTSHYPTHSSFYRLCDYYGM